MERMARRPRPDVAKFERLQEEHAALLEELAMLRELPLDVAAHRAYLGRLRDHLAGVRAFRDTLRPPRE